MPSVYVVDVSSDGYPGGASLCPTGPNDIVVPVSDTMDSNAIVQAIEQRLARGATIDRLHLASHGNSGTLFMGRGLRANNLQPFGRLASRIAGRPLRPSVLVHGCAVASATEIRGYTSTGMTGQQFAEATPGNVASGVEWGAPTEERVRQNIRCGAGFRFLAALASVTRAGAVGAVQAQDVDRVARNGWQIEGATITVFPAGNGILHDPYCNSGMGSLCSNAQHTFLL